MKILITGGTGFIGRHLVNHLYGFGYQITVLARNIDASLFDKSIGLLEIDITTKEDIEAAIIFLQPDVVIHTAAMSKPNDCELQKEACFATNVTATNNIAEACKAINALLIFLSTDFVFGHHGPYNEDDAYDPVNYYGHSKALAEQAVISAGIRSAIVRTVLVVGKKLSAQGNTFLHWINENLKAGNPISVYTDQQRNITYVNDLCIGIQSVIETGFTGIIHLAGKEILTPFQLAEALAEHEGFDKKLIIPVDRNVRPEIAARPEKAILQTHKAIELLQFKGSGLQEILDAFFS